MERVRTLLQDAVNHRLAFQFAAQCVMISCGAIIAEIGMYSPGTRLTAVIKLPNGSVGPVEVLTVKSSPKDLFDMRFMYQGEVRGPVLPATRRRCSETGMAVT